MKISIITVVYNNSILIKQCIESVLTQDYLDKEYIVVDGGSDDGTLEIIKTYKKSITTLISEKDNGLYDAMNKGIQAATGDVVGILNSDDLFYDNNVLSKISLAFSEQAVDATISDIVFFKKKSPDKVARKYSSKRWRPSKFAWGYMPPHPSFFVNDQY
jgi:glycosyltransferase involved in cell wall biosynthesis